jgi:hypothetical protein
MCAGDLYSGPTATAQMHDADADADARCTAGISDGLGNYTSAKVKFAVEIGFECWTDETHCSPFSSWTLSLKVPSYSSGDLRPKYW